MGDRFPNPLPSFQPGRTNGFRHRRVFHAGSHSGLLPPGAPRTPNGLVLVRGILLGAGGGGNVSPGGEGGDYIEFLREFRPEAAFSVTIGAAGANAGGLGGNSTLTIDGTTFTALGGGQTGTSTGDIVSPGGAGSTGGGAAGSPWGPGQAGGTVGGVWLQPQFWDLDDPRTQGLQTPGATAGSEGTTPENLTAFTKIWGIGNGAGVGREPGYGGGGGSQGLNGNNSGEAGGPGIGFLYY